MLLTLSFQSTGTVPGSAAPVAMLGASITLGRGDENDMVLPDPDRLISKRHCVIEDHGNSVVIIDLSTNGTFLNYSKNPLGSVATPINNGDILSLGTYELLVSIVEEAIPADPAASIAPPLAEAQVSHGQAGRALDAQKLLDDGRDAGDFLDGLLGSPATTTGPAQLIPDDPLDTLAPMVPGDEDAILGPAPADPYEGMAGSERNHNASVQDAFAPRAAQGSFIPDDWDVDGAAAALPPAPTPVETPQPQVEQAPSTPVAAQTTPPATGPELAARAFIKAAGVEHLDIKEADLAATMARLGTVMQTLITGIREVLMTRAAIKSEFRMNQTMIGAGNNNPLKFSISVEQALELMVQPPKKGYLDPAKAAGEALKDIKAHEVAMVTGMEAALKGLLARLDPAVLEQKIETGGGLGNLLKGKKARYWEVYEKMYAEISDQAENDFQELFSKEFSRAYQAQLKKL